MKCPILGSWVRSWTSQRPIKEISLLWSHLEELSRKHRLSWVGQDPSGPSSSAPGTAQTIPKSHTLHPRVLSKLFFMVFQVKSSSAPRKMLGTAASPRLPLLSPQVLSFTELTTGRGWGLDFLPCAMKSCSHPTRGDTSVPPRLRDTQQSGSSRNNPCPLGAHPDDHSNGPNVLFATRWSWERIPWKGPADSTPGWMLNQKEEFLFTPLVASSASPRKFLSFLTEKFPHEEQRKGIHRSFSLQLINSCLAGWSSMTFRISKPKPLWDFWDSDCWLGCNAVIIYPVCDCSVSALSPACGHLPAQDSPGLLGTRLASSYPHGTSVPTPWWLLREWQQRSWASWWFNPGPVGVEMIYPCSSPIHERLSTPGDTEAASPTQQLIRTTSVDRWGWSFLPDKKEKPPHHQLKPPSLGRAEQYFPRVFTLKPRMV